MKLPILSILLLLLAVWYNRQVPERIRFANQTPDTVLIITDHQAYIAMLPGLDTTIKNTGLYLTEFKKYFIHGNRKEFRGYGTVVEENIFTREWMRQNRNSTQF